jgi:hypothetical protein
MNPLFPFLLSLHLPLTHSSSFLTPCIRDCKARLNVDLKNCDDANILSQDNCEDMAYTKYNMCVSPCKGGESLKMEREEPEDDNEEFM